MKIAVSIPSHGQWVPNFGVSLARMMAYSAERFPGGVMIGVNNISDSVLPRGRNRLVAQALSDECTHVLFLDSDMEFPPSTLIDLLIHDVPIVAVNYVRKSWPTIPTAYNAETGKCVFTLPDSEGLEEVTHVGCGVMLIKTEVFKTVPAPWFMFEEYGETDMIGEDVYFCREAIKHGFKVYIDHGISHLCAHIGTTSYLNDHASKSLEKGLLKGVKGCQ